MELKNLSQNWKRLQDTLRQDNSASAKRKAPNQPSTGRLNLKRRRTESKPSPQRTPSKHRSRPVMSDGNLQPSASVALLAEDKNIPVQELAAANGVSVKSTTLPATNVDAARVNEGLSHGYVSPSFSCSQLTIAVWNWASLLRWTAKWSVSDQTHMTSLLLRV